MFHHLGEVTWLVMKELDYTWADVMSGYSQPEWCEYPDALEGMMGCWSLVGRMVTGRNYCKNCDCYRPKTGYSKASPTP